MRWKGVLLIAFTIFQEIRARILDNTSCDEDEFPRREFNHQPLIYASETANQFNHPIISKYSFCHEPYYTERLPIGLKTRIRHIWSAYRRGENCETEVARTRNLIGSISAETRSNLFSNLKKPCQPPPIIANLPRKVRLYLENFNFCLTQRKIVGLWQRRDPNKGCKWEKQKTRFILLNLPQKHRLPPPFRCEMPHFVHRLEPDLQRQIQKIWIGYHDGAPCFEQIDRQLAVLQANEISMGSFRYPPPEAFSRIERLKKFRRESRV